MYLLTVWDNVEIICKGPVGEQREISAWSPGDGA